MQQYEMSRSKSGIWKDDIYEDINELRVVYNFMTREEMGLKKGFSSSSWGDVFSMATTAKLSLLSARFELSPPSYCSPRSPLLPAFGCQHLFI
jgi:hypothetical protein